MTWSTIDALAAYAAPGISVLAVLDLLRLVWRRLRQRGVFVMPPKWRWRSKWASA